MQLYFININHIMQFQISILVIHYPLLSSNTSQFNPLTADVAFTQHY